MKAIKKYRNAILKIMDIAIIIVAYYISAILINDVELIANGLSAKMINTILLAIITYMIVLHSFRTYKNITRYENGNDYLVYVLACLMSHTIITIFELIFIKSMVSVRVHMVASLIIVVSIIGYIVMLRLMLI